MKKKRLIFASLALLLALVLWVVWGNATVGLTTITVTENNLPEAFDGYRIAHVSDLHNSGLWKQTIEKLKTAQPNIICITGDLVDAHRTDISAALAFAADQPLILVFAGIVYLIEALSVMLQVFYFKISKGKRLFLMAPIHHHFEKKGWKEEKIVLVFSTVTVLMCLLSMLA